MPKYIGRLLRCVCISGMLFLSSCLSSWPAAELQLDVGAGAPLSSPEPQAETPLEIWTFYVGQGDAALIRFPNRHTLLIDAGTAAAGRLHLLPWLRHLGINGVDALLVTHYDADHLGGVPALLAGEDAVPNTADDFWVGAVYDRGGEPWDESPFLPDYLEAIASRSLTRNKLELGDALRLDEQVSLRCVAINGSVLLPDGSVFSVDLTPTTYAGRENAASAVLLLQWQGFRYLSGGDLTGGGMSNGFLSPDVESGVAEAVGQVDVVHVNHHGSASSSNEHFVVATSPQAVFIQAGHHNPYGHPAPAVVQRWEEAGAAVYSTHSEQSYRLKTWGQDFEVEAFAKDFYSVLTFQ